MQRLWAIAWLTVKASTRYRLFVVLGALLLLTVVALPLLLKEVSSARDFTQILLTYNLTVITALLGFATLWLACGLLAREVEECQIQMVVVKPVARWQIWLGKWLGIMLVNFVLLLVSGAAVYGLLLWRAHRLPEEQQKVLRQEVLVARGAVKEQLEDLEPAVEQIFQERLREHPVPASDRRFVRDQLREQLKARLQVVQSGYVRRWVMDLGAVRRSIQDQPLYLRVRFSAVDPNASTLDIPKTYPVYWQVGVPDTPKLWRKAMNLAADTYHEFEIPPNLFDARGELTVECLNPNEKDLLFLLEDGLEVLYREGGFTLNYGRGLAIIFCWLGLLAALGLAAASFLSFPVAAFVSLGVLMIGLSTGTLSQVIEEGGISGVNHDTGRIDTPLIIDRVMVPLFSGLLKVINLVRDFSPIDSLSTGRSITWGQLTQAGLQIIGLMGGLFGAVGMITFTRRELATASGGA